MAIHWYVPAAVGVKLPEPYVPLPFTGMAADVNAGLFAHDESFGPYALNVTEPPARLPSGRLAVLAIVAVSLIGAPRLTGPARAFVTMVGNFGVTTTVSFEPLQTPVLPIVLGESPV